MQQSRRLFRLGVFAIAIFVTSALPTLSFVESANAAEPQVITEFAADDFGLWTSSSIYGQDHLGFAEQSKWKQLTCVGWDDPSCTNYDNLFADLILPPCTSDADRSCIAGVEASGSDKTLKPLTFYKESATPKISPYIFNTGTTGVQTRIPGGGGLSVWKSSELDGNGNPKTYGVHVLLRYIATCPTNRAPGACTVRLSDFKGSVYPVSLGIGYCQEFSLPGNECAKSTNFNGDERIALTLRLDKNLTGWIFGRMQNADFSVDPLDDSNNKIRIEGDVTLVPELQASVPKSQIANDSILEKYLKDLFTMGVTESGSLPGNGSWNDDGTTSRTYPDFLSAPTTRLYSVNYDKLKLFSGFEKELKAFTPPASNNGRNIMRLTNSIFWNFGASTYIGNNACSSDKSHLQGLVVTNASIYDKGPPTFADGTLNYRVAGIHTNVDGSLFRGRYTYIVKSETARCYYGFSKAPIEAKVEVVSADNSNQIATTLVSEKNGFIKLQADNFTFSSPTIRVKLMQEPTTVAKVPEAPAKVIVSKAVKTITCAKGKVIKKVSSITPTCPTGYKKK